VLGAAEGLAADGGRAAAGRADGPDIAAARAPLPGLAPGRSQQSGQAHSRVSRSHTVRAAEGSGPDIGWIVACVGLLAAAAILGLTEDGRKATRKGHGQLVRLLRPLTGRG
jgi:hypothetical protein